MQVALAPWWPPGAQPQPRPAAHAAPAVLLGLGRVAPACGPAAASFLQCAACAAALAPVSVRVAEDEMLDADCVRSCDFALLLAEAQHIQPALEGPPPPRLRVDFACIGKRGSTHALSALDAI